MNYPLHAKMLARFIEVAQRPGIKGAVRDFTVSDPPKDENNERIRDLLGVVQAGAQSVSQPPTPGAEPRPVMVQCAPKNFI